MRQTQKPSIHSRVRQHLLEGNSISPLEAFGQFGTSRLGGIIYRLRREGLDIATDLRYDVNGHPYARYHVAA